MQTFTHNKFYCCGVKQLAIKRVEGFTLIEMLAAFVLLSLLAATTLPNLQRWFENTGLRVEQTKITQQVQQLLVRCALLGQNFELNARSTANLLADGKVALSIPTGWRLAEGQTLQVQRTGFCPQASLVFEQVLSVGSNDLVLDIDSATCEVRRRKPAQM